MEHSPWEANSSSASQDIPQILWYMKIHYRHHKSPEPGKSSPHTPILCNKTI